MIVDGSIGANQIAANSITADELRIASTSGGGIRMSDNTAGQPKIEVYDNSSASVFELKSVILASNTFKNKP